MGGVTRDRSDQLHNGALFVYTRRRCESWENDGVQERSSILWVGMGQELGKGGNSAFSSRRTRVSEQGGQSRYRLGLNVSEVCRETGNQDREDSKGLDQSFWRGIRLCESFRLA